MPRKMFRRLGRVMKSIDANKDFSTLLTAAHAKRALRGVIHDCLLVHMLRDLPNVVDALVLKGVAFVVFRGHDYATRFILPTPSRRTVTTFDKGVAEVDQMIVFKAPKGKSAIGAKRDRRRVSSAISMRELNIDGYRKAAITDAIERQPVGRGGGGGLAFIKSKKT